MLLIFPCEWVGVEGTQPLQEASAFCRIRPQSAVVLSTVYIFRITLRYFGCKIIWEELREFLLFWCRKKKKLNNPHNFRL